MLPGAARPGVGVEDDLVDTAAQQVELASVGLQLPLQVLYEDVRLEKSASAHP